MTATKDVKLFCLQCPRSFTMQDFFEKHKRAHKLKRQHACYLCGFVYGAAKGLEGHLESVHGIKNTSRQQNSFNLQSSQKLPFELSHQFFERKDNLESTNRVKLAQESVILLQKAEHGMLSQINKTRTAHMSQLSLFPLSINPETSSNISNCSTLESKSNKMMEDKSKIPSPAGTGKYKIYDYVPEIKDAADAQQNESGFFHCTICAREFSGLNSLKKHVPIHTRRIQHKCDECGYVFGKKEYLLDHIRKHTGEISPVCEVCGQTFNKSLKLKEHLKLHRNLSIDGNALDNKPFKCHMCKYTFFTVELLKTHLRSQHSETVYKCDMCTATFGDVRGKNHHMYNEHQLDAFHQKCVWCPVCNQGFTRHYNLKVHMYKSHGKDYLENNFSSEELDSLMRPPPGSNSSKTSFSKSVEKDISVVSLPISPPLTPKFSPKQKTEVEEQVETALDLKIRTETQPHSFEQERHKSLITCELCNLNFVEKQSFLNHFDHIHKNLDLQTTKTNYIESNEHFESSGFKCVQCSKVLMHKQSFVSHMRVIHGDYYGGNKWNGSKVVEMVLGDSDLNLLLKKENSDKKFTIEQKNQDQNKNEEEEPETKRLKLSKQEIHKLDKKKGSNNNDKSDNNSNFQNQNKIFKTDLFQIKEEEKNKTNIEKDDTLQFEPEFLFKEQLIKPSYCVIPFVDDSQKHQLDQNSDEFEYDDARGKLMILDTQTTEEKNFNINNNNSKNYNNNLVLSKQNCKETSDHQNKRFVEENLSSLKYNQAFAFSLSAYLQKKRDMSAILVPRFLSESITSLDKNSTVQVSLKNENCNSNNDNNAAVSEYENQVQSEIWPINCIKCKIMLQNLENFNLHMNDHWSDDKCCPVCGLLINSKRFNFKQHLKIHTGEKPFVCRVCSRAFRQKAHMVKHVTTHKVDLKSENITVNNYNNFLL